MRVNGYSRQDYLAYVRIRQHTSAYVSMGDAGKRLLASRLPSTVHTSTSLLHPPSEVSSASTDALRDAFGAGGGGLIKTSEVTLVPTAPRIRFWTASVSNVSYSRTDKLSFSPATTWGVPRVDIETGDRAVTSTICRGPWNMHAQVTNLSSDEVAFCHHLHSICHRKLSALCDTKLLQQKAVAAASQKADSLQQFSVTDDKTQGPDIDVSYEIDEKESQYTLSHNNYHKVGTGNTDQYWTLLRRSNSVLRNWQSKLA